MLATQILSRPPKAEMTDEQRAEICEAHLKLTTVSYPKWQQKMAENAYPNQGRDTHWFIALDMLDAIEIPPVPEPEPTPTPPPPPEPQPSIVLPKFGWSTGAKILTWDTNTLDYAISKMKSAAPGGIIRYDASSLSSAVIRVTDKVLAAGMRPYLIIGGTTSPKLPAQMAQIASDVAGKYGDKVFYTGPNEPDLHGWTPVQLADVQAAIFKAIHDKAKDALVGYGALWKSGAGPQAFVKALIAKGNSIGQQIANWVSFHGYDPPDQHASWVSWDYFLSGGYYSETAQSLLKAAGWDIPIVCDETGAKNADKAYQAALDVKHVTQAGIGRVAAALVYCSLPDYDATWNVISGLNGTEYQAYRDVRTYMTTH